MNSSKKKSSSSKHRCYKYYKEIIIVDKSKPTNLGYKNRKRYKSRINNRSNSSKNIQILGEV